MCWSALVAATPLPAPAAGSCCIPRLSQPCCREPVRLGCGLRPAPPHSNTGAAPQETSVGTLRKTGTRLGKVQAFSLHGREGLAVARCPLPHPDVQVGQLLLTCVHAPLPAAGEATQLCLLAWRSCPSPELLPELRPGSARSPGLTSVDVLSHHAEVVLPEATGGESRRPEPQATGAQGTDITCSRTSHT